MKKVNIQEFTFSFGIQNWTQYELKSSKFRHHHVITYKLKVQDFNDFCHQIVK